jgi:type II secretory ATPase GspE/PulE/Tfp pilus assembly ATPase PilB-like protein
MEKVYKLGLISGRPTNAIGIFDYIVATALKLEASDIHISLNQPTESLPEPYLLRYRVFGRLQIIKSSFLTANYKELIARIKVLAEIPSTDIGIPLDGQLTVETEQGPIVLRISTIPCQNTEEIVIRVLRNNNKDLSTENLQMTNQMKARINKIIRQKSGLILLNGPAGSGKTTTIYSILNTIASAEKKIITAEDPVETRIPFVNHTQVTSKTSFASLGRSFMRQDAEVIFIGEIRDEESAHSALQLAQTGHLVLSTLHARDAIGAISRLEALSVHVNNIATTLIGSLSQRLVASLCDSCKEETVYDEATLKNLNAIFPMRPDSKLYKAGPGCDQCLKGYSGRLPIFELFIVDEEIAEAINRRQSKLELLKMARKKGMASLAEEALLRVYAGYTDLDSVQNLISVPDYNL